MICHSGRRTIALSLRGNVVTAAIACLFLILTACGDDNSSSAPRQDEDSSIESSSSSVVSSSSGDHRSSSSKKKKSSSSTDKKSSSSSAKSSSSVTAKSSSERSSSSKKESKTETEVNHEYGELVDERDGQTYKTVKIGDQVWMAENLNYETDNSFCFKDSARYCEKYGRFYTWAAAMDSAGTWSVNGKECGFNKTCSPTSPVRGVCPEGWHLPDTTEWNTLFTAVGGWLEASLKLKSTSGWNGDGNGTDDFGFSALPAGGMFDEGYYDNEGNRAYFWSSMEYDDAEAYYMYLYFFFSDPFQDVNLKFKGFNVRCLKD